MERAPIAFLTQSIAACAALIAASLASAAEPVDLSKPVLTRTGTIVCPLESFESPLEGHAPQDLERMFTDPKNRQLHASLQVCDVYQPQIQLRVANADQKARLVEDAEAYGKQRLAAVLRDPQYLLIYTLGNRLEFLITRMDEVVNGPGTPPDTPNRGALARYQAAIAAQIERDWVRPADAKPGLNCQIHIVQAEDGKVLTVEVGACNGDDAVRRSIYEAAYRASPLPLPPDPGLFDRDVIVTFAPHD